MFVALYEYLIQNRELSIPGIGSFTVTRNPALMDFPGRKIDAPSFSFSLHHPAQPAPARFFYWLGRVMGISDREAVIRFNDFSFDMRRQIMEGATIDWKGVGVLSKGLAGEIKFVQAPAPVYEKAVGAEKVIRDKPDHMVRVGEDQKTSAEMVEMLGKQEGSRSLWWVLPLAIGLLAVMFIGWHLSENGVSVSTTGNGTRLKPMVSHKSYEVISEGIGN